MEDKQSPKLVTKNFTKVPNWFFDELLKAREPGLICVVAYLLREFVGWQNRSEFKATQKALACKIGIHGKVVGRWLNALTAIGWIEYTPAKNGGGESKVCFLRLPENAMEVRFLVAALRLTDHLERHWARKGTYIARSEKNSYVEWLKRPRLVNDAFSGTLANALDHIKGCAGCDTCLVVKEVVALHKATPLK